MNITELDEWQGLTAEMIQAWLIANGWQRVAQMAYQLDAPPVHTGWLFRKGDETVGTGATLNYVLSTLSRVVQHKTPQELLREINPRMRKGWPSDPALAAHSHWMARHAKLGCIIVGTIETDPDWGAGLVSRTTRLDKSRSEGWEFWPCDEYGSKVRWPVDAEGKML